MTSEPTAASSTPPTGADAMAALAVLGDESRRRLLEFVGRSRRPVTREEASAAVGISRKLAVPPGQAVGVRAVAGPPRREGPRRVGRAPKVYAPAPQAFALSFPPRRHELLASLLTHAVTTQRPGESAHEASLRVAREHGESLGAEASAPEITAFLESLGFDPEDDGSGRMLLHNCPFHPVAVQASELVCAMNHAFLYGYLAATDREETTAVLVPRPGSCCVELHRPYQSGARRGRGHRDDLRPRRL